MEILDRIHRKGSLLLLAALAAGCASSVTIGSGGVYTIAASPNPDARPTYGSYEIDAQSSILLRGEAGGILDARSFAGDHCPGHVAQAPDFVVEITAGAEEVRFAAEAIAPIVILIKPPHGDWVCAANTGSEFAALSVSPAAAGRYAIWLGSDPRGNFEDAQLRIEAQ